MMTTNEARPIHEGEFGTVDGGEPLTQDQVNELPDGTEVVVIWSGGNGPHNYFARHLVVQDTHEMYVVSKWSHAVVGFLTYVGNEPYHTRVWLADQVTVTSTNFGEEVQHGE
jgi:hypothetical protein